MSYQIAICDDEPYFCDELENFLYTFANESSRELNLHRYYDADDLLKEVKKNYYHLLFLDIEIGSSSGIKIAEKIRTFDADIQIVFVTSHKNFALNAYQLDAIGYLVKPLQYAKLKSLLQKTLIMLDFVVDQIAAQKKNLQIKTQRQNIYIPFESITYMEKLKNRIQIHTTDKDYTTYETFINLIKRMDMNQFVRIHQGYIVNFDRITCIEKSIIRLDYTVDLPISRKYYKAIKDRFYRDLYA